MEDLWGRGQVDIHIFLDHLNECSVKNPTTDDLTDEITIDP